MAYCDCGGENESEKQVSDAESSLYLYLRNEVKVEASRTAGEKFARELWSKMQVLGRNKLMVLKTFTVMLLESITKLLGEETDIGNKLRGHVVVVNSSASRRPFDIGRLRRGVYTAIVVSLIPVEVRRNWPSPNGFFTHA